MCTMKQIKFKKRPIKNKESGAWKLNGKTSLSEVSSPSKGKLSKLSGP